MIEIHQKLREREGEAYTPLVRGEREGKGDAPEAKKDRRGNGKPCQCTSLG